MSDDFDPGAVPPAADPLADPAEQELKERLEEARALLDGLRPVDGATAASRFLEAEALEAAALLRQHDRLYHWRLNEELRPYRILRSWHAATRAAAEGMADAAAIGEKTRIVQIGTELLELWRDDRGDAWASPREHGASCCWRVPGGDVRRYLLRLYGERNSMALEDGAKVPMTPGRQAVAEALDQLEAIAHGGAPRPAPALRVAGDAERLVLDLCDEAYRVAQVTAAGWDVLPVSPVALRRAQGMLPLPVPVSDGDALGELRALLGWGDAEHDQLWALYTGFMFAALRPVGPYFLLVLGGDQGTGKSTAIRNLRKPVDPHATDIQTKPRSEDDLFANCTAQWLTAYDNLSTIDQHWSDAFCRIATGAAYSKRKLYTDGDTVQFQACRPQIITSIIDVAAAPDLLDRSLLATLPELERVVAEEELLAAVDALVPRVLGQLLDAAVLALRDQGKITIEPAPRMLGPARWIEAGAPALRLPPGAFLEAYRDSQRRAGEMALEASLIGAPLQAMLSQRAMWAAHAAREGVPYVGPVGFTGTAAQLLADLNEHIRTQPHPGRGWPQTARGMSGALRRIAPALRRIGWRVEFMTAGHAKDRIITIETPASRNYSSKTLHPENTVRTVRKSACGNAGADGADGADGQKQTSAGREDFSLEPLSQNAPENRKVQVAFMITARQRAQLRGSGYTDDQIRGLRPADAHRILEQRAALLARGLSDQDLRELTPAQRALLLET